MLGLWMTFGRAGKSAWTALKSGALENIQSTMQYQNTLRQLGVTMDGTKVKASQLISAMARLSRNETTAEVAGGAMAYGNVAGLFTGSVKGMEQMGEQAEKTASKVAKTGQEARLAAEGLSCWAITPVVLARVCEAWTTTPNPSRASFPA
jgi:hypothetical protein